MKPKRNKIKMNLCAGRAQPLPACLARLSQFKNGGSWITLCIYLRGEGGGGYFPEIFGGGLRPAS